MGGKLMHETHQACRAQMGSISVTHTMAPRAFRAVQQPFPTYTAKDRGHIRTHMCSAGHIRLLEIIHLSKVYFQE